MTAAFTDIPEPFKTLPVRETECPDCGYAPLHYRYVDFNSHMCIYYTCALCRYSYNVQQDKRP